MAGTTQNKRIDSKGQEERAVLSDTVMGEGGFRASQEEKG